MKQWLGERRADSDLLADTVPPFVYNIKNLLHAVPARSFGPQLLYERNGGRRRFLNPGGRQTETSFTVRGMYVPGRFGPAGPSA